MFFIYVLLLGYFVFTTFSWQKQVVFPILRFICGFFYFRQYFYPVE